MANWKHTIRLNPEWDEAKAGKMKTHELAAVIAKRLQALPPFRASIDDERNDIAAEFAAFADEAADDVEWFDHIMDRLYDWGDISLDGKFFGGKKCCWIDTMSRPALTAAEGQKP